MQVADISEIRILDFASGLSGFPIYATEFELVKAYDNYSQIPLDGIYNFHAACGHKNSLLIRKEEIHLFNPNIISVFGFWLSESWIYDLPSVQIIISDSLYNSGSIKGEGIFHYLGEKAQTPEDFGYRKVLQFPLVDIYVRLDTIKSNVGDYD